MRILSGCFGRDGRVTPGLWLQKISALYALRQEASRGVHRAGFTRLAYNV